MGATNSRPWKGIIDGDEYSSHAIYDMMSEFDKKLWRKEKKLHIMFVREELDKYRGLIMQQYIEGNELDKPSQYGGVPIHYVKKHQVSVGGRRKTKKNKRKSKKQKKL